MDGRTESSTTTKQLSNPPKQYKEDARREAEHHDAQYKKFVRPRPRPFVTPDSRQTLDTWRDTRSRPRLPTPQETQTTSELQRLGLVPNDVLKKNILGLRKKHQIKHHGLFAVFYIYFSLCA
jgi:hypothetical protein